MSLESEIKSAINRASRENASGTPDFILAEYLMDCLTAFEKATTRRTTWHMPKEEYLALVKAQKDASEKRT